MPPARLLPSLLAMVFSATAFLAGCAMTDPTLTKEQFATQVDSLLSGKDVVVVEASKLTSFPWTRLCFERDERLLLRFEGDGARQVLELPYEEFFVDEGHVANSLEEVCLAPGDLILIKKKYPGYQGPIEFQKAG